MHKLRKFYYDNKYKIWAVVVAIVLLLAVIQIFNKMVEKNNNINVNNSQRNIINSINSGNKNTSVTTDSSVVTGEKVEYKDLEKASEIIEEFISQCNSGNIEQAYNLLTDDCKEEMYQSIEKFKELYYDQIFADNMKKTATIENWVLNTYIVNISNDIMATGGISSSAIQDYITIEEENDILKISVNNFIKKEKINKTQVIDNIEFQIIEKSIYVNDETYTIKVTNKSENNIILDDLTNTKSIYLENNNGIKYYSQNSEIIPDLLVVNKGFSTQFNIKFSKEYSTTAPGITSIVFSGVNLDSKELSNEKKKITINL